MHDQDPWVFWTLFEVACKAELRHAANERLARQALASRAQGPSDRGSRREPGSLRKLFIGFTAYRRLLFRLRATKSP